MENPSTPGVVFTPDDLARRLVAGWSPSPSSRPLRVLDPACGEGALLAAARRRFAGERSVELLGIECRPEVASRAREALGDGSGAGVTILTGDALDPDRAWPHCDFLVANPPWVSFSGRQAADLGREVRARYERWAAFRGWPSLHGIFLERIARHVAETRCGARVLIPASVCQLPRYGAVREAVSAHAAMVSPPEILPEDAFDGVCEPAAILSLGPGRRLAARSEPWSGLAGPDAELVEALGSFPRLPPESFRDPGVHTGNCSKSLIVREEGSGYPPIREGRDVRAHAIEPARLALCTDLEPTPTRRFRMKAREYYDSVPIVVRQTADRPVASLHLEPTYFRNSLLACTPPESLDPAFCAAVLNGPVAAAWHRIRFADARQRAFPQVKVAHLRSQPFPILDREESPELHDRLSDLARRQARTPSRDVARTLDEESLAAFRLPAALVERVLARAAGP